VLTISFALHRACFNPELRILIVSNTADQAQTFLREIRDHLSSNVQLARFFGHIPGRPWSDKALRFANLSRRTKEPTFSGLGAAGAVISRHYDLIILDDLVDEENARTKKQREKIKTWLFKLLLPCLEPEGELHILGTRYHHQDLYGSLLDSEFAPSQTFRAIDRGGALWPERFPLDKLKEIRAKAGPVIFNAQYQNDTEAMKGAVFREGWIKYWSVLPAKLKKFQGVDLAISSEESGDYFAHVTLGVDHGKNLYILDAFRGRLTFEEQFRKVQALYRKHDLPGAPVLRVGIEANAYQEALPQRFRAETDIPVKSIRTLTDKFTRALKLQGIFENGKIYFPGPGQVKASALADLIEELLLFPEAEHDDLFDALELAASQAREQLSYADLPEVSLDAKP